MEGETVRIPRARETDLPSIAHLLMVLARAHVGFDARRRHEIETNFTTPCIWRARFNGAAGHI